ncbi:MAG TPA: hypothetical protein VF860_04555 [Candidatus Acidoferrales bacterium]
MSSELILQYLGFVSQPLDREYTFSVREPACEPRVYTLTITNAAFDAHRARFQDAPDICSLRLRRELAASGNHVALTHFSITDTELEDYRGAHAPRKPGKFGYAAR